MNRLVDYEVFLLHDWQRELIHSKGEIDERFPIKIFGSFLNPPSWQVSRIIIQNLTELSTFPRSISQNFQSTSISHSDSTTFSVALIFFPLSTNYSLNFQFKNHLIHYLQVLDDSTADYFIKGQINEAARYLRENLRLFREKYDNFTTSLPSRWAQSCQPEKLKKQKLALENRFLFGALAAKWLTKIDLFPQVWVGEHHYNGIPLQETLVTFLSEILYPEIATLNS